MAGKTKRDYWLTMDGLLLLAAWARDGLTDGDIAKRCGVAPKTLREWKKNFPLIGTALKKGKEIVDLQVENALLKRALGYTYEEKTWEKAIDPETGESGLVLTKVVTKEVVPDVTAQIYWLKNRKRETWKNDHDKAELDAARLELEKERVELERERISKDDLSGMTFVVAFDGIEDAQGWAE